MKVLNIETESGWISGYYDFGFKYGYRQMLDFFDSVIAEEPFQVQRVARAEISGAPWNVVTDSVLGGKLQDSDALRDECGVISVAGRSSLLGRPIQIVLYNQTSVLCLQTPEMTEPLDLAVLNSYAEFLGTMM